MRVVYLSGGVGGARLLHGFYRLLPAAELTVIVNVGDDLTWWGLEVSPDVDTVLYTLAGVADEARGWGLADESFRARAMVERHGGPAWFALGDADIGTHLMRTAWLREGLSPTEVTARLATGLGVGCAVLPASDLPQRTYIETHDQGRLAFQEWLVRHRGEPSVRAVTWEGDGAATAPVLRALDGADLVVIGPSNPYVSIDPILALPGVRARVARRPVVAVSPIVAGRAVKGPLARMIPELTGKTATATAIAEHYGALLSGFVVEHGDVGPEGLPTLATSTVMRDVEHRERLATEVLAFAGELVSR